MSSFLRGTKGSLENKDQAYTWEHTTLGLRTLTLPHDCRVCRGWVAEDPDQVKDVCAEIQEEARRRVGMGKTLGDFSIVRRKSEPCCEVMLGCLCSVLVEASSDSKGMGWCYEKQELRTNRRDFSPSPQLFHDIPTARALPGLEKVTTHYVQFPFNCSVSNSCTCLGAWRGGGDATVTLSWYLSLWPQPGYPAPALSPRG